MIHFKKLLKKNKTKYIVIKILFTEQEIIMADNARERIQKMKDIIKEEAEDKARKIREQSSHQFNIEKNKILNQQKDKVIQEFKNKLENYSVQRRM